MKLVNHDQFLALPEGTVFMRYWVHHNDGLCVKGKTTLLGVEYRPLTGVSSIDTSHLPVGEEMDLQLKAMQSGDFRADTENYMRTIFDADQQFIVLDGIDLRNLYMQLLSSMLRTRDSGLHFDSSVPLISQDLKDISADHFYLQDK
jgi:hypothetical protein